MFSIQMRQMWQVRQEVGILRPMSTNTLRRLKATKSSGRMVRLSEEASKWMEKAASKRRLNLNAVVDVLLSAFKKLPAEQQAREFAGGDAE